MARRNWLTICSLLVLILIVTSASCFQQKGARFRDGAPNKEEQSTPKFSYNIYSKTGNDSDKLDGPLGVAVSNGKVFVANSKGGKVLVFDVKGNFLSSFQVGLFQVPYEQTKTELSPSYPVGIAISDAGDLYVSNIQNGQLEVFSIDGKPLGSFIAEEKGKLLLKPLALTCTKGRLYVTDIGDQSVKIFTLEGNLLTKFGQEGRSKGEFLFPNGVVVAKDGTIFVADSNNSRVQAFNSKGKYLFLITGTDSRKLKLPRALAFDHLERLHIVDTLERKIYVFNNKGKFLFSYGRSGTAGSMTKTEGDMEKELGLPVGIAIDKEKRLIFITDKEYDRVSVWKY